MQHQVHEGIGREAVQAAVGGAQARAAALLHPAEGVALHALHRREGAQAEPQRPHEADAHGAHGAAAQVVPQQQPERVEAQRHAGHLPRLPEVDKPQHRERRNRQLPEGVDQVPGPQRENAVEHGAGHVRHFVSWTAVKQKLGLTCADVKMQRGRKKPQAK